MEQKLKLYIAVLKKRNVGRKKTIDSFSDELDDRVQIRRNKMIQNYNHTNKIIFELEALF